jgi:hypothetical protein
MRAILADAGGQDVRTPPRYAPWLGHPGAREPEN